MYASIVNCVIPFYGYENAFSKSVWKPPNPKAISFISSLAKQAYSESNRTLFPIGVKAIEEVEDRKLVWEEKSTDATDVIQNRAVVGIVIKPDIWKTHVGKCIRS